VTRPADLLSEGKPSSYPATLAEEVIGTSDPGDPELPADWPAWARVLPHVLAVEPADSDNPRLQRIAERGAWYLVCRGEFLAAHDLARRLHERWWESLGPDEGITLRAATTVAAALHMLGEYAAARALQEDVLARRRRVLGADHADTQQTDRNLALTLRALGEAESGSD
jgi:Tetratricopeptide repeat